MTKKKKKKKPVKKKAVEQKPPDVTPYPAAGPKVTTFEQKLDEQIAAGDKPKRGRPPKQPEPEPAQVPNEIIRQAVQVPFDLWAISQQLKGLKLEDKEAAMLADPVKTLLDYYVPQMPVIALAWASLTISVYAVMKPRLEMIAEIKKQKTSISKPADVDRDGNGHGGPTPSVSQPAGQKDAGAFPRGGKIVEFPERIKPQKL